jgi:predicted RNase H-like nuclease
LRNPSKAKGPLLLEVIGQNESRAGCVPAARRKDDGTSLAKLHQVTGMVHQSDEAQVKSGRARLQGVLAKIQIVTIFRSKRS